MVGKNSLPTIIYFILFHTQYDADMCSNFELYKTLRANGSIGQMEVKQVAEGTFQRLKALMIEHTQNQAHKMPRVLRNKLHLKYLLSQEINYHQFEDNDE